MSLKKTNEFFDGKVFAFEYFKAGDIRGDFGKMWTCENFPDFSMAEVFFSKSKENVIRGLHYVLCPAAQKRIVFCLSGKVRDIVVDIRKGSPTYGKYISVPLNAGTNVAV